MRVAPFGAHSDVRLCPQATQTFGLCALGLPQVKAFGLVQVFDLPSSLLPLT